ncbi:MAG: hypothetical protein ACI9NY_002354 [Kiritimatiellia bacterium]|jgi:hypothetical protein
MSQTTIIGDVDYGPLAALVGTFSGDKGVAKAPEPGGEERNFFKRQFYLKPLVMSIMPKSKILQYWLSSGG